MDTPRHVEKPYETDISTKNATYIFIWATFQTWIQGENHTVLPLFLAPIKISHVPSPFNYFRGIFC